MANEFKTLPIGTIFTYNGNKYKVCKDDDCHYTCNKCAFNGINCDTIKGIRGNCIFGHRTDHAQIYYVQINDETMNKDFDNNIITPTFNTDNSLNDLHIDCPKGYSIDVEHSDLSKGIIKFKNDNITLEDIYKDNNIDYAINSVMFSESKFFNKLLCIAKLIDIANYYNKGWKPDWNNSKEHKYYILFNNNNENGYSIEYRLKMNYGNIFFKNEEDAQAVIDNPNFRYILDTIYKH